MSLYLPALPATFAAVIGVQVAYVAGLPTPLAVLTGFIAGFGAILVSLRFIDDPPTWGFGGGRGPGPTTGELLNNSDRDD